MTDSSFNWQPFNRRDLIFDLQLLVKSTLCGTDNTNASLFLMLLKIKIKMMHTLFDSMLSFSFVSHSRETEISRQPEMKQCPVSRCFSLVSKFSLNSDIL